MWFLSCDAIPFVPVVLDLQPIRVCDVIFSIQIHDFTSYINPVMDLRPLCSFFLRLFFGFDTCSKQESGHSGRHRRNHRHCARWIHTIERAVYGNHTMTPFIRGTGASGFFHHHIRVIKRALDG